MIHIETYRGFEIEQRTPYTFKGDVSNYTWVDPNEDEPQRVYSAATVQRCREDIDEYIENEEWLMGGGDEPDLNGRGMSDIQNEMVQAQRLK